MDKNIKIFYSYSNNNDMSLNMYNCVCDLFHNNENIKIIDTDEKNNLQNNNLLENIKQHIDTSQIFICDLTPDYIDLDNNKFYHNANVMLEIGYATKIKIPIIYVINRTQREYRPSLLKGIQYDVEYENDEETTYMIHDKIIEYKDKLNKYLDFESIDYILPTNVIGQINNIIDVVIIKYDIKIQKKNKLSAILFYCNGGYPRILDIKTRKLYLKNKEIDITNFDTIYEEIKHIELLANIEWYK
jgi:hypothetical protein